MIPCWSVLVCGVAARRSLCGELLDSLARQIGDKPVELLYLLDNQRRDVGSKRNALLAAAAGAYVSFVDDDDSVSENYVSAVFDRMVEAVPPPDVIVFGQLCHLVAEGFTRICSYSLGQAYEQGEIPAPAPGAPRQWWKGPPAHTMVWASQIAKGCRFPAKNFGEDVDWVAQACARATTQLVIDEVLYHYRFDPSVSLTRSS